jgi:hypothetical protein
MITHKVKSEGCSTSIEPTVTTQLASSPSLSHPAHSTNPLAHSSPLKINCFTDCPTTPTALSAAPHKRKKVSKIVAERRILEGRQERIANILMMSRRRYGFFI